MITKRIICLANSRKTNGRCIAGKEILPGSHLGGWIRPVSIRPSEEVSMWERQYSDGSEPQVLDVIDIPLINPTPKSYQQENWLLDPDENWVRVKRITKGNLDRLTDQDEELWTIGHSSYNGCNDRIPISDTHQIKTSLRLIRVPEMVLQVFQPSLVFGNPQKRVQGHFSFNEMDYSIRVTDPEYEGQYLQRPCGDYEIGERFLTVSLGEPYKGHAYKLIAAIISPLG